MRSSEAEVNGGDRLLPKEDWAWKCPFHAGKVKDSPKVLLSLTLSMAGA